MKYKNKFKKEGSTEKSIKIGQKLINQAKIDFLTADFSRPIFSQGQFLKYQDKIEINFEI